MAFYTSELSLPALDGGGDRLSVEAFLPWSDLVYPLLIQAPSAVLTLSSKQGEDAPGVDLMAFQIDLVPYNQDL